MGVSFYHKKKERERERKRECLLAMDGGQRVWAPHPEEGYQLGLIVDVSTDTLTVDPLQGGKVVHIASYIAIV